MLRFVLLSLGLAAFAASAQTQYDIVIRNGRIADGTGNPWFYGDVGLRGERIATVGPIPAGTGKVEIDAKGLVIAPGFIDMHSHSDWVLIEDGDAQSKIRQGVTTEVLGESGSVGPFKGKLVPRPVSVKNETAYIRTIGEYFGALERSGVSVNVATYVGQGNIWQCVMGDSFARPDSAQLQTMRELVAEKRLVPTN